MRANYNLFSKSTARLSVKFALGERKASRKALSDQQDNMVSSTCFIAFYNSVTLPSLVYYY